MNKNIIIILIAVIIIAVAAAFMVGNIGKTKTSIVIINNETFQNGENLQFVLKDAQGNAIAGQPVEITFNGNKHNVTTDNNGKGYLVISGEKSGKVDVEVKYGGNNKYAGSTAKETITITNDVADHLAKQTNGSSVAYTYKKNTNTDNGQNSNNSPNNPFPGSQGTYFVQQYELWVRTSDNVVIDSPNGQGLGLTLDQWIAQYGSGSPDYK